VQQGQLPTVLVTGGSGFLGRRLGMALRDTHRVVLAGRNNKQNAAAHSLVGCEVLPVDVCRIESVRDAFAEVKPSIVIHAAATKFVDLAERQPMECVDVNVVGSQNVARVAIEKGAEIVLGISTDKASPPVRNTYGLSKALMERMFCSLDHRGGTRFACVRYGNVAWSTGSVLPIWKRMHEETGVIGSTGPDMRRFFFTVDEAVGLVLAALRSMDRIAGKVLARHMKAALIRDVLDLWITRFGGTWQRIEGRPGERDDEFLVGELELAYTTKVELAGVPHYLIAFNERATEPWGAVVSSATVERLSEVELLQIISNPPVEDA
jgi:UDP-N-acetylglucosamine 4,6-dehydratase/5-epimerase